ncbi:family 43 glycosylhydrolase [Paenibacillus whitsoniae]|nr:family 43 glycosylhydrolase [Paenibacillus whitsoniae]
MEVTLGTTYQNPFTLEGEWEDYGIGDPYILRFDGKYYLYCSTKDKRIGIKAWSSDDLVHWKYEGLVTEEPITESAYAPEVVYWNGSFYMYTSPAGKGHYVLQSDKPTGPFVNKTDNLGFTIDGSVFIDDDARWYFTHAKNGGIMASSMSDPYTIGPDKQLSATSLGHWTEGSMIIKRNGRYFITYTGNHVFSKGYRVNYGVNHESPVGTYKIPGNNPILISTADDFNGLGHSATVLGPDLDAYYIVYHNLVGRSAEGPPMRKMNIDRLVFNGDKMSVLGPTHGVPQEAPKMPVFQDIPGALPSTEQWERIHEDGQRQGWLARTGTGDRYTGEFNFVTGAADGAASTFDVVFAYADSRNYRVARIRPDAKELTLMARADGKETELATKPLPAGTDLTKLHTVRVESDSTGTKLYWDNLLQIEQGDLIGIPGRIGYQWTTGLQPELHFTAFSGEANGSSDREAIKPLPGTMDAVHGTMSGQAAVRPGIAPDGSDAVLLSDAGDSVSFPVNVREEGSYLLAARVSQLSAGATLRVEVDGTSKEIKLDKALFAGDATWSKVPLGTFALKQGTGWLTISRGKGEIALSDLEANLTQAVPEQLAVKPNAVGLVNRFGGMWGWSDYTVSFDLTLNQVSGAMATVLLRTTNESDHKDQVKDGYMGYALAFGMDKVSLKRNSYENSMEAASGSWKLAPQETVHVTVKLRGASISVFTDRSKTPILTWTDPNAFLVGRVGLSGTSSVWTVSPLSVAAWK